jgi:hypothetical protein
MQPGKVLFIPVGIAGGVVAGIVGRKLFDFTWSRISDDGVPAPEDREASWGELTAALALEGAISRLSRGLVERGARVGFLRATGTWPGEEKTEAA